MRDLIRPLIQYSVAVSLLCGASDAAQALFESPEDPLGIAAVIWVVAAFFLWIAQRTLASSRPERAVRSFTIAGLCICFVLPMFESPNGALLALTMGPVYVTLALAGLPTPRRRLDYLPVLFGLGTTLGILVRHWIRPLPAMDNPWERLFAAAGAGLVVVAIAGLGQRVISATHEAQRAAEKALADLQRNHVALVLSRDQALAASRAKASFLANMSHELRTPLNAILGYVELMTEEAELEPDTRKDLDHVEVAAHHLLSTITEILDLSRIEAGQTVVELAPTALADLAADVETILTPLAHKNGNHLEITVPPLTMATDGPRLRQVLINLLGNAAKFTTNGVLSLTVAPHERAERPGVAFTVADNGIGISAERLEAVFEPFNTSGSGGSGIGLTLSRAIADQLGGTLTASSELGVGSTFVLWLPRRD